MAKGDHINRKQNKHKTYKQKIKPITKTKFIISALLDVLL